MKNKKLIIPLVLIVLIVAIGLIFLLSNKKIKYEPYDKYSLTISLDIKDADEPDTHLISIKDDGTNAYVSSTKVEKDTYIIGSTMYYLDGNTFYTYKLGASYRDIYKIISKYKNADKERTSGDYTYYTIPLKASDINELLDALYFGKKTSYSAVANLTVLNDQIYEFNLVLDGIDSYKEISINLKFASLDDDFKVDTSKIYGSGSLNSSVRYKFQETKENPYEVAK